VKTTGPGAKEVRQGVIIDPDGTKTMLVWLDLTATSEVTVHIDGADPAL
jgi:hypothetical protein